jgi:hypothetical protein
MPRRIRVLGVQRHALDQGSLHASAKMRSAPTAVAGWRIDAHDGDAIARLLVERPI